MNAIQIPTAVDTKEIRYPTSKRAAIYARVSTDDQADKGYSLPSQIEACQKFAERIGYSVALEVIEDHSGATPIAERPQGATLSQMAMLHEVDAVIVYQIDRLSRDIVNLLATIQMWLRAGVEVYSLDVGKIESEIDIVLVIKGWQGSDERKKIRERSMRGKRAKAKAGKVVGSRAPYGYTHVRDTDGKIASLEPVEDRAQIVKLIYRWYILGDETGALLSAGAIARRLSEMGVATPGEVNRGYSRKRGPGIWQACAILSIISNEVYAGAWHFGVRIGSSRNERPREEWITVQVPAIMERDVWELAQAQRPRNRELSRRNAKHEYLLSGYVLCACGRAMSGECFSNHCYYSCTWRNNHHPKLESRTCRARSVRADAIEADVWESVAGLFFDGSRLERLLRIAQEEEVNALNPKQGEYAAINAMIGDAVREAADVGQGLRRANGIVAKTLEKTMMEVNQRYDALCLRRDVLQAELRSVRLTDGAIQEAIHFAEEVRAGIENADYATRRRILGLLHVKVVVDRKRFSVTSLAGDWQGAIRELPKVGIVDDWC